jgi:hypothetical protein
MQDLSKLRGGPLISRKYTSMTPEEFEFKKSYNQFMGQQSPLLSKGQQQAAGAKFLGESERKRMQMQKETEKSFQRGLTGKSF